MRTLIVDNYDSFTFNLYQLLAEVNGEPPLVVCNDEAWDRVRSLSFDNIVISPGPGRPERPRDFGISADALTQHDVPLLGVCLGHQGLGHACGGRVVHAPVAMHGRASRIFHDGSDLFEGVPQGFLAVRYHSLVLDGELPACLERTAWTEDGIVMGIRHRERPHWGVQFHPESVCTEFGARLLGNFKGLTDRWQEGRAIAYGQRAQFAPATTNDHAHAHAHDHDCGTAARRSLEVSPSCVLHARKLALRVDPEDCFVALYGGAGEAFWLDSSMVVPGLARFSFMGDASGPRAQIVRYRTGSPGDLEIRSLAGTQRLARGLFDFLREEIGGGSCPGGHGPALPFTFRGGYVGYLGYELRSECVGGGGCDAAQRSSLPDAMLLRADRFLAFDHEDAGVYLCCLSAPDEGAIAIHWLDETEARLRSVVPALLPALLPALEPLAPRGQRAFSRERATYLADIDHCLRAIREGESYEICLTNQLHTQLGEDALTFYRRLRRRNPAPFAAYLRFGDLAIACSSPERFLRVDRGGQVESRPIKGTAARGTTAAEDAVLREGLARSEKDRAENLMIVDLVRNDLGRVCEVGSVHVPDLMRVETYATVHQLVSTVRGRLRPDCSAVDAILAAFPGGSMTGAPKRRTLEILAALEGEARGAYSGAIGYLSLDGAADLNIVIRTAVARGREVSIGVGGAIVAQSDPDAEYAEMLLKAEALLAALDGD